VIAPRAFTISRQQQGTTMSIRVTGELDLATSPQLREVCARKQRAGVGVILIDLAQVSFIDSTGLHALLAAASADTDQRLRIILSEPAARLIDLVKLRDTLPIIEG
jgi:anti-sigma B factor antagonist